MKINKTDLAKSIKQALVIKENLNMSSKDLKDVVRRAVMQEAFGDQKATAAGAEQLDALSTLETKMKNVDAWQQVMSWALGQLFNPTTGVKPTKGHWEAVIKSSALEPYRSQIQKLWQPGSEEEVEIDTTTIDV
jgi:hypothetical protein